MTKPFAFFSETNQTILFCNHRKECSGYDIFCLWGTGTELVNLHMFHGFVLSCFRVTISKLHQTKKFFVMVEQSETLPTKGKNEHMCI